MITDMTYQVHSPHWTQKVTEVQDKCPKMGDPSQYRYIVLQPSCKTSKHQKHRAEMNLHKLNIITKYKSNLACITTRTLCIAQENNLAPTLYFYSRELFQKKLVSLQNSVKLLWQSLTKKGSIESLRHFSEYTPKRSIIPTFESLPPLHVYATNPLQCNGQEIEHDKQSIISDRKTYTLFCSEHPWPRQMLQRPEK